MGQGFLLREKKGAVEFLCSILPTRKDLAYLFAKHIEKLWPKFEVAHKFLTAT
jgi:hypothetical protein